MNDYGNMVRQLMMHAQPVGDVISAWTPSGNPLSQPFNETTGRPVGKTVDPRSDLEKYLEALEAQIKARGR
jgi:hypothetical protein